jgi:hypothetical protein
MIPARDMRLATLWAVVPIWLVMCGLLLLTLWPWRPASPLQWLLFIVLGPLVWVALEYVAGLVLSPKISGRISPRRFSWLRIGYGVVAFLLCFAILYGAMYLVGNAMSANDA